MNKKKLALEQLKVKSFVTVMGTSDQKTAKGGFGKPNLNSTRYTANWTTIKTQKSPFAQAIYIKS